MAKDVQQAKSCQAEHTYYTCELQSWFYINKLKSRQQVTAITEQD